MIYLVTTLLSCFVVLAFSCVYLLTENAKLKADRDKQYELYNRADKARIALNEEADGLHGEIKSLKEAVKIHEIEKVEMRDRLLEEIKRVLSPWI